MKHYQWVKEEIEKLLAAKVICTSHSSWSAPIIEVPKCNGGKCLVIDYRALNKVTRKFTWPMPKVEDIFSKLNGAIYFTTLDLEQGTTTYLWISLLYQKLHLIHISENLNMLKYHLVWLKHWHISRN